MRKPANILSRLPFFQAFPDCVLLLMMKRWAGQPPRPHALDYEIKTDEPWNYAIVPAKGPKAKGHYHPHPPPFLYVSDCDRASLHLDIFRMTVTASKDMELENFVLV